MISKAGFQKLRGLSRKKQRLAEGRFIVEGWRSLEAVLDAGLAIEWLLIADEIGIAPGPTDLLVRLREASVRIDVMTRDQLRRVAPSVSPSDLAAVVSWKPMDADDLAEETSTVRPNAAGRLAGPQLVVVADGISDPGNLGTLIRTADWFGARGLFAGPGSVELTNPKVVQATMGSLFQLPVGTGESTEDFVGRLKESGYGIASLELDGSTDVRDVDYPDRLVLIVGNETRGVSTGASAIADWRVRIPRFGRAESLNAAASIAAILGYVCLRPSSH